jgi:SAM-dependent methyltransferase
MSNPTERFSNRVADYVRARPGYPPEVIDLLTNECGLSHTAVVADVGSGTGILTRLLLERAGTVIAIEPNAAMRAAAEEALGSYDTFTSLEATAETTTLADHSVDLITAAQAFHWFKPKETRREFGRILRPSGAVALIWNDRRTAGTPFLEAYEQLLQRFGTDYTAVNHTRITPPELEAFFGGQHLRRASFPNTQVFDHANLERRLLSSSYVPGRNQPGHQEMLEALAAIFAQHQADGRVELVYDTIVFYGPLRQAIVARAAN